MTENDTPIMNNSDDKFDELLARWLSDDLTEEELRALEAEEGQETLVKLRQVAEASAQLAPPPLDHDASWSRLAAAMEAEEEAPTLPLTPSGENNSKGRRWGWYGAGVGIAASIAIVLMFVFSGNQNLVEFTAEGSENATKVLPDGSRAILKPGSTIRYAEGTWSDHRSLELEGEAYFQVEKGETFTVENALGQVEVLGTRFLVSDVSKDLHVTCYTGSVSVKDPDKKPLITIQGGEYVTVKEKDLIFDSHQDEAPAWAVRDFTYDKASLDEVLQNLEQEFDITLECASCAGRRFTGSFSNQNLSQALDQVFIVLGLKWEKIEGRRFRIQ